MIVIIISITTIIFIVISEKALDRCRLNTLAPSMAGSKQGVADGSSAASLTSLASPRSALQVVHRGMATGVWGLGLFEH